jgi:hypothetical protein
LGKARKKKVTGFASPITLSDFGIVGLVPSRIFKHGKFHGVQGDPPGGSGSSWGKVQFRGKN